MNRSIILEDVMNMTDHFKKYMEEFSLSFDSLCVSIEDIKSGMGQCKNEIPEPILHLIKENLSGLSAIIDIKGGYCIYDNAIINHDNSKLQLDDLSFHIGKVIGKQMKGSESVAVFVCTIGSKITDLSKDLMKKGDMLQAYVVDTIGSETVERAMDKIQENLARNEKNRGRNVTNRFSPGYCSWHLTAQHDLFSLIPENFCGVTLTESSLMIPIKSVSGIIGIGKKVKKLGYPCKICNMVNCFRRK